MPDRDRGDTRARPASDYHEDEYEDNDEYDDEYEDYEEEDGYEDYDDYEDLRPEATGGRRVLRLVLALLFIAICLAGVGAVWVQRQLDPPGAPGDEVALTVPEGSTTDDIGALLAEEDVISGELVWGWYIKYKGVGPFQAGDYTFRENSSMSDAISVLDGGPAAAQSKQLTIPEGLTTAETLDRLASPEDGLGFDRIALQQLMDSGRIRSRYQPPEQPSTEGILFPDTYDIDAEADPAAVLALLAAETDTTLDELDVTNRAAALGRTPYEILVIASLIEEETKVLAERPKVARVIYNRLEQGIPLGIDATSRYEALLAGRTRDEPDFESQSPYNTRRIPGIPPTPIASPGRSSIEAALAPEAGDWIYYVLADEEGNHLFTASASEFEQAKADCKARGLGCG